MESERRTRRSRIDPRLKDSGWQVAPFRQSKPLSWYQDAAIEEFPTSHGPADYGLCVDGQIAGIVEAKKLGLGPQNVLTQAERYARGVINSQFNFDGLRVPFLYSTNGEIIWFHDVRHPHNRSRKVSHFHTPNALREFLGRDFDAACQWLAANSNNHPRLRDYQIEANAEIEKAIAKRKRNMLVAMATGTGKTFMIVNQVYRLMKSGVARRILFLVDRRALAAQAVRTFASFEPEPGLKFDRIYEVYSQKFQRDDLLDDAPFDPKTIPESYLTDPQPQHSFVYVCTIQRMTTYLFGKEAALSQSEEEEEDANQLDIPIHAFDLVIADECHRGYTSSELSVWRNALDHFDAIKIGLTATPASHTTTYFNEVVYRYEYERAVREGHLVDYDPVKLKSNVRLNGVFVKEGEEVGLVNTESGAEKRDYLEDERDFKADEVEEKVTSPDSNKRIVQELQKYADEHEQKYGRFPKTLIFADNDQPHISHADQIVNICRDVFERGDSFVQKITGRVDRPLQRIREFRNRPNPGIAVTVDLLSTGVDIPDLEFIVLLRVVKSRILFEQMLGRGTRKGERFSDKSHFVVFDCFDGTLLKYFNSATSITAEPPRKTSRTVGEIIDDIWKNNDRDYNIGCLVKRLRRVEKEMSGDARTLFEAYIPDGDVGAFAEGLTQALRKNFTGTMKLLRDPGLQRLLTEYPRPPKVFLVAYDSQDEVSSERLFRDSTGKEYKPEDYIQAFTRFVRENPAHIEAINILRDRPKDWGTKALSELQKKLATAGERFTVENLRRAHEIHHHKALVDIISMVKHAIEEDQPLLTAEERVSRAIDKITAGETFTPEQQQWLERIRTALVETLSIEKDDFDELPVLSRAGGWGRANRAFNNRLPKLLSRINEAIAA
ncbi:MAG: DEAD/DEAH box helicase family protein [Acidobacteria bacterium]|nr:DEAD/DEAH box helicase family protein [Acidobacteriota bacterium]